MAFDVLISVQVLVAEDRDSRKRMESYCGAFRTNRPEDPLRSPAADSATAPPDDLASLSVCTKNCVSAMFCRKKSAASSAPPCSITRYAAVPAPITRPRLRGRQFCRLGLGRARDSRRRRAKRRRHAPQASPSGHSSAASQRGSPCAPRSIAAAAQAGCDHESLPPSDLRKIASCRFHNSSGEMSSTCVDTDHL